MHEIEWTFLHEDICYYFDLYVSLLNTGQMVQSIMILIITEEYGGGLIPGGHDIFKSYMAKRRN